MDERGICRLSILNIVTLTAQINSELLQVFPLYILMLIPCYDRP